ncbi:hypothetical protein [Bradyrhizobium sp. RDI18]|uniref:hypothetical protein n=1 Tax=Bradyrhizobium sp. RDI18 TaxID=3367400 RepID=UPI003717A610
MRWCSKGDAASVWIGIIDGLVKLVSLAKAPRAINNVVLPAMGGAVWYMLSALV